MGQAAFREALLGRLAVGVARAALVDRLAFLGRASGAAHDDAALLDDVSRVGAAVFLTLDAAARIVRAIESVRVAFLLRRASG